MSEEYKCKNGHSMSTQGICVYPHCGEVNMLVKETWSDIFNSFQIDYWGSGNQLNDLPDFQKWLKENYSVPIKLIK